MKVDNIEVTDTVYQIDGITVNAIGFADMSEREAGLYVKYVCSRVTGVREITLRVASDGKVDVDYVAVNKFERIRRITG